MNNGSEYTTTSVVSGQRPTFPDAPTSCDDESTTFYGWATSTWSGKIDDISAKTIYTSASAMPTVTSNMTYHAVFCKGTAATWEPIISAPSDWSGEYVIVNSGKTHAMTSDFYSGSSGEFIGASVTITDNKVVSPTDKMIWIVAKNGSNSQYSFQNKSTSTYANITGTSSTNAALSNSAIWFTIASSSTSGVWKVNSVTNSARCFAWYSSNNSFRTYANSSNNTGYLYKKSGGSTSKYLTTCCISLGQINGPINLTHTETSSSVTVTVGTSYTDYNNVSGYIFKIYDAASAGNLLNTLQTNSNSAADRSQTFTGLTASTNYWVTVTAKGDGSTYCATSEESARVQVTTSAAACVDQFSLHTGTKGGSDWVYNKCFVDADWGASDDAIYVGEFPSTNECYVGYAGSNSYHGAYWAVGGIKTYDLPNGRTLGWNSGNYYSDYPATALGTFHIYKNSTDENYYLRFKPTSYVLRTGSDGTSWTSRDMTVSGINSNYYESDFVTLTSTLISEHAYVDLKANNGDGHVWCNFSNDRTASGNVKVKNGASTFRATDLQASDNGTYGKFQIDITQDVDNWKLAFVPYFHITYNANGGTGSTEASSYVEVGSTAAAAANGFTAPAHTSFGGWATSAANAAAGTVAYAAGANITLTADVELFAIWTPEANATITLNNYTGSATTTGYYAGDSFTLPSTNSYSCNDKTFVGWSTVEIATPSATKPASNFYEPGASVTLGATNTFYAVFAEGEDVEDELNNTNTVNSTSSSYSEWSDVSVSSDAVYAGQSAGEHSSIQLRSNNSNSGIVTTTSGGKATKVVVEWNSYSTSGRVLDIYGKNSAYEKATDLYNASNQGTKLGSITYGTSTELTITGDYAYIGLRSNSGAMYIDKITITWSSATNYSTNCVACNEVTVSYTAPSNGNAMTVKKGSTTISSGDAVKTCSAVDLTVTLTPAAHFTADGLTAKIGSTDMVQSHTGNVYTVTIPQDATGTLNLTPTFTAETPLTITFDVPTGMGTAGTIGTIYSGDNFDFPNVTGYDSDCVDFIGWVDATSGSTFPNDGTATSEPTGLFKYNDNSGAVTTDKTYKAVYGEKVTDYAESYAKVTSAQSDYSGKYLIVCESAGVAFDGSLSTLDATDNKFAVTASAGSITTLYSDKEWTITKTGDNYTIKSASGYYIGKTTTGNGLSSSTSDAYTNTISVSSGTATITSTSQSLSLKYNNATNQNRFRYYGSGQQDIQLYKYGMNEVVTYTYTTAPACGDKYFVTLASVTGGAPTASPKAAADGTTINIVANPNNGYTFTSWTITKDADDSNVTSTLLGANSATASTSFTMPAYDVTVTAAYSITNYTITYNNLNGASNTNPMSYTVATADINLADPGERSGYVFKGWYDDAVYTNRVTTIANGSTGDISLYAKWAVGYTITWQNGVGATNPTPTGIEDGQSVGTLPVPTGSCELNGVEYSNFVGWYTGTIADVATDPSEAGTLITSATVPNGNVTYHAVYTNMPDYSSTHTSNVTLPSQSGVIYTAKVKVGDADDAPQYDAIKIGSNSTKTSSFNFTVPSGTTRITVQGAGWSGKTTSITLATSVGTISPSTAQSLDAQSGATGNSPFTITSNTTLTFNLTGVTSEATITLSNSGERVVVWGINASSASGSEIGYITQCCDNMLSAPVMNTPTVRTSTAITLSWNAVANATGYKVSWNGGDWEDVGTTTTYAKTSLEPETDYAYRVIAKYTTPYCGATPVEGVVSTKPVYTVTYAKGTGTGSCSANGTVPAVATYEAGQVVTIVANPFTLAGNTFAEWVVKDASDNTVTVTNGQFTMPESNVTITATWTAKQDRFFDRMHDGTDATHGGVDDGNGHYYIVREGCQYVMPTLTDDDTGTDICHTSHYKLLGWVAESHINTTDGTIKADALDANGMVKDNLLYKPGVSVMTANNQTFYAVWAKVVE
ncbi:MAG: InlB B-repeat-containing protein [Paludibacteraceae bacterium]|nr:InlB B-repeat-containing protein [Paludibacteraceae bacterium]